MAEKAIKRILIILFALIIIAVFARYIVFYISSRNPEDEGKDTYDYAIEYMQEESVNILLYGNDIAFRKGVNYEIIPNLEELEETNNSVDTYVILNDLDGQLDLSQEDVVWLKDKADKDIHFSFFYIGKDKLELFQNGTFENFGKSEKDMSFGYVIYEGDRMTFKGIWNETDHYYYQKNKELLGENIMERIHFIDKSNN